MKQKYVFEPEDFEGSGQMLIRDDFKGRDPVFGVTVAYKVGYMSGTPAWISLADGAARLYSDYSELCEMLNNNPIGFRPMTKDEIVSILGGQGNRFSGWRDK